MLPWPTGLHDSCFRPEARLPERAVAQVYLRHFCALAGEPAPAFYYLGALFGFLGSVGTYWAFFNTPHSARSPAEAVERRGKDARTA